MFNYVLSGFILLLVIATFVFLYVKNRRDQAEDARKIAELQSLLDSAKVSNTNNFSQISQDITGIRGTTDLLGQELTNFQTSVAQSKRQDQFVLKSLTADVNQLGQAVSNNTNNYPKLVSRRPIHFPTQSYSAGSVAILNATGDKSDGSYTNLVDKKPESSSLVYTPFNELGRPNTKSGFSRLYQVTVTYTDNYTTPSGDRSGNSKIIFYESTNFDFTASKNALELDLLPVWGATNSTQTQWRSRFYKDTEVPSNHCWVAFKGSDAVGAGTIYNMAIETWDVKYCGCYVIIQKVESDANNNAVVTPYLSGPWINNNSSPIPVQKVVSANGVTYYMSKDGDYVKIAASDGTARFYSGGVEDFSPDKWTTYSNASNCDCLPPKIQTAL